MKKFLNKKFEHKEKSQFANQRFSVSEQTGLNQEQLASRINDGLTNKTNKSYSKTYWEIIRDNMFTFFNIFLYIIAIALLVVKQYSSCFFMVIQFANIFIGIFQDVRAKIIIDRMRLVTAATSEVIRDGKESSIPSTDVVLDDIVILSTGKQIIADGIIKDGAIEVNESMLTGESIAVKKKIGDMVYGGSYVTSGKAIVQIDKVGENNYVQQLQKKAKVIRKPKSELLTSLNYIFRLISFVIIPFAVFMLFGNYLQIHSSTEVTFGEKIATVIGSTAGSLVSMIPAGMFLLTSMTLTVGVIRLSKKRAFIQELYSIESLARVDVICLDKTGTITDGTMCVEKVFPFNEISEKEIEEVMGSFLQSVKDSNQTSMALLKKFPVNIKYKASKIQPFSSDRKYSGVSFNKIGTFLMGAPEYIYKGKNKKILSQINSYVEKGNRVILLSKTDAELEDNKIPEGLEPYAMFVLSDRIRADAEPTIRWFKENDVDIKIISGDNPCAVSEIAKSVGVEHAERFISLEGMAIEEVERIANSYTVFGRVNPEQKAAIIRSIRAHGHTAAMIGDGVNDILALKEADCSVAMAAGSEAARDAAHVVLLDSNFSVLPSIVAEGRRSINNLQNVSSLFLVKTVFSISFSLMWLIVMFTSVGQMKNYPFLTNHMYIWEILSIGFASFFMALQKNERRLSGSFTRNVLIQALPAGILIALMVATFYIFKTANLFTIDDQAFLTLGCLTMYIMSFVILFRLCLPFNWYRTILYVSLVLLAVGALLVNEYVGALNIFKFHISDLSSSAIWTGVIVNIIGILIYVIINISSRYFAKKNDQYIS